MGAGLWVPVAVPSVGVLCFRAWWEASSESPWVFDDASHHAREHKTPTEGTAHGIHRPASKNLRFRHPGFFVFQLKICCPSAKKVFGSTPFSKGVAGCRAGSPAKSAKAGVALGVSIDRLPKINGSGIPDSSPFHKKHVARPQKKFSDRPLFQKGVAGLQGGKPCEKCQKRGNDRYP